MSKQKRLDPRLVSLTAAGSFAAEQYQGLRLTLERLGNGRGAQALVIGGKIRALLNNRLHVSCDDIRSVAYGALRHRVLLNFEGEAERVDTDTVIKGILENTPEPS